MMEPLGEVAARVVETARAAMNGVERITAPGLYLDMDEAAYYADPCPAPSLTQSIAKILLEHSPAHARLAHPRLNPDFQPSDPKKYDIGRIAHALFLGRGRDLVIIEGDDWVADRKAKSEAREAATAAGKLAVLSRDYDLAREMAMQARIQLTDRGIEPPWPGTDAPTGNAEAVIAWPEGPLWFRAMIDWLPFDRRTVIDYKTTGGSAAPHALAKRVPDDGWDVQAAMHERGLNALFPEDAGRRQHLFVVQENYEPFALTVVRLPESALTMGRKKLAVAAAVWAACMDGDHWPGYPAETLVPEYPDYAERRWLDREIGEFEPVFRRGGMVESLMGG